MRIEHDSLVEVPAQGSVFDALVNANLLVQRATALVPDWWKKAGISAESSKPWPVYGIYDETGEWLEVWVRSEAEIEAERFQ